jgi:arylsulfatase A-like enzyme/predicted Zn-dependent protease
MGSRRSSRGRQAQPSTRPHRARSIAGAAAFLAAALAGWWWRDGFADATPGPIILISIDTLRADHLPAYGYRGVTTSAIDALASDGVLFERAYAHSPQTLPAHASMFSGALPFQHGVRDNVGFNVKSGTRLLPHFLRERGLATAGVVSADVLREETGIADGFDFYDSRMPQATGGASIDEVQRDGSASLAVARQWMQARESPQFFLFLHLYEPHAPYSPPERYAGFAPYDGEIAYADEIVAGLVRYLRERDWYDDALVVLLSDHGEGLGDHGEQEHGLFLYDEAVRVPLIVKLPRSEGRGRRVRELAQHADLLPTIVDLAGGQPPLGGGGRSLRPLLEGHSAEWQERGIYAEALFGRYHFGWRELYSFTDSRFRLIRAPREELYDLQQDPREQRNLAAERKQTQAALSAALDDLLSGVAIDAPGSLSAEARERLASLGYVGPQTTTPRKVSGESLPDPKDRVHILVKYRRALELEATGSFRSAIDLLKEIAGEEPAMGEVWQRIARIELRLGQTENAIAAYKRYARLNPTSASGLIELASALLKLREFDAAETHAKLAATVVPASERAERAGAYEMLVKIALARENAGAARRYAALGEEADPTLPLAAYADGRLSHAAARYDDARRSFDLALSAMRTRTMPMPDLHLYAGDTLARLGRFEEAERHFKEEIQFFPRNLWGYVSLANLYQAFERRQEAEQVLSVLLQRIPSPEAHAEAAKLRTASR